MVISLFTFSETLWCMQLSSTLHVTYETVLYVNFFSKCSVTKSII